MGAEVLSCFCWFGAFMLFGVVRMMFMEAYPYE